MQLLPTAFQQNRVPLFTTEHPMPKQWTPQIRLAIDVRVQERTAWCWAAVAEAVYAAYGEERVSQCEVATRVVGQMCCPSAQGPDCNTPQELRPALGRHCLLESRGEPQRTPTFVKQEIDAGAPICVRVARFGRGGGHFVVIGGYVEVTGVLHLIVLDPRKGRWSIWRHERFRFAYENDGDWDITFQTQGARPVGRV
jgi:hypothetical protein